MPSIHRIDSLGSVILWLHGFPLHTGPDRSRYRREATMIFTLSHCQYQNWVFHSLTAGNKLKTPDNIMNFYTKCLSDRILLPNFSESGWVQEGGFGMIILI